MMRDEILSSINNIAAVKDQTYFDVNCSILNFYDKQQTILEHAMDDEYKDGFFMESSDESGNSTGFIRKIINAIKKFIKMLAGMVNNLINKVTGAVNGKQTFISCNSIVLKVLSKSKANKPDDISTWKIPKVNKKYQVSETGSDDKEVVQEAAANNSNYEKYITMNVPARKGSVFYPKSVKVPDNDIIAEINNTDKTITFNIVGRGKWNKTESFDLNNIGTEANVTGTKSAWTHSSRMSLYLISEKDVFDEFIYIVDKGLRLLYEDRGMKHKVSFNTRCRKIIDEMNKGASKKDLSKVIVSLNDLTNFQKKVNELSYKIDQFANMNVNVSNLDKVTINTFNAISAKILDIQVSMNLLTSSLSNNLIIDKSFIGCIKNLGLLDEFVNQMINAGVPPKYISYNTWLVADECIKGNNNDKYKPIWGQTRFIFFPPTGKFVYKIAMSGAGITSNRAEARTSKLFVEMGRADLIAPIIKTFNNDAIVVMEKVDNDDKPSYATVLLYSKRVNSAITDYEKKYNKKLNVKISDQHIDNVKYDKENQCYRSIDYGIGGRVYSKK